MENQGITCSFSANVSANEVFKGICKVSEWWVKNTVGNSEKLNDVFTIHFGGEAFVNFKIIEVISDKKIVWHVTNCFLPWLKDKTEWNDTKVVFEISSENNLTKINFTHIGITPEVECYESCVKGWIQYVEGSLPKLLTEGKGQPA